jgi:macrolide transport system ATP-binding/permease protein
MPDVLRTDLRFALRQLRKNPAFTLTAILVLALGISASLAIFSFVDAALLKPLPYLNPARLIGVYERIPLCDICNLSYEDFLDWRRLNKSLDSFAVYNRNDLIIGSPTGAERAINGRVSTAFLHTLGLAPILGRDFSEGEDKLGAPRVTILSYATWQSRFGASRDVIGRSTILNNEPYTIIGVLGPDFQFAPMGSVDFFTPLQPETSCEKRRSCHDLYGIGRLKDAATVETASADFALIAAQLEAQYPDSNRGQASNILPLSQVIVGPIRSVLITLLSGSALLLLIAAVNVANLLLVRSEGRRREIAVRTGLGASPARLAAQFITEGALLVLTAATIATLASHWLTQILTALIPQNIRSRMPYFNDLGLHSREWTFIAAVSLAALVLFTLTPVLRLKLTDLRAGLNDSTRSHSGFAWKRLGSHLVIVELATAVILLVGAGLLAKSLYRVLQVDLGMRPSHLATLQIGAPHSSYSTDAQFIQLHDEILRRVSALPGIESASTSSLLPITGGNTAWIRFADRPFNGEHNDVAERQISPNYFTTLGAHLLAGRFFTEDDTQAKPLVIMVDHSFVQKYYPSKNPIGQQIFYHGPTAKPMTIVGVIADIKEGAIDAHTWPAIYIPFNQDPDNYFNLVVRTFNDERAILPTLVAAIHQFDRGIMTGDARTMSDQVNNSSAAYLRRSSASLALGFAALALILGIVGLYGVIAYSVSQRTREIGVRIALGAHPRAIHSLILKEAAVLVTIGVALGLAGSIAAAALLQTLLFETKSWDAPTFTAVALLLAISALIAALLPARRAASVNPIEALRAE